MLIFKTTLQKRLEKISDLFQRGFSAEKLILEEIICIKRGCLLVRCSKLKNNNSEEIWEYYEVWRSKDYYRNRVRYNEGKITNMGLFNYNEINVVERFNDIISKWDRE